MKKRVLNIILLSLFLLSLFGTFAVSSADTIDIRFFKTEGCEKCAEAKATLDRLNQTVYNGKLNIVEIETFTSSGYKEFKDLGFSITPAATVNGTTKLEGLSQFNEASLRTLFDSILNPTTVTPQPTTPTDNGKTIRFFYEEQCEYCKASKAKMYALIEEKGYNINVVEVDVYTPAGYKEFSEAGFKIVPAVIVCGKTKLEGVNQVDPKIQSAIEGCLAGKPTNGGSVSTITMMGALGAGFFSSFSPCLLAVLSFIIAYTAGTSKKSITILLKSIFFGLGITVSYVIVAIMFLKLGQAIPDAYKYLISLFGAVITFVLGLNLLNSGFDLVELPITTKHFAQKMTHKFALSYGLIGVFILGMIFSVIKLPCAAIILPLLIDEAVTGSNASAFIKVAFYGLGVIIPFIAIGVVGAFTKNVARDMRWNPTVRFFGWVVVGAIVIIISFWLILQGFEVVEAVTTEYILYTILSYAITMFIVGFAYGKWKKVDKGDDGKKEVRAY
ncbi:MAG: cytochrome c biogenesis protein CcdA [Candidatus Methanofastidiosum sp.]|nr:cytochrome c biogenesis protein CcdA [Methanofastidiosum sp.]